MRSTESVRAVEGRSRKAALQGSLLVCPWHGRRYDCRTGVHHFDRDVKVAKYPVLIDNGDILIDVT